MPITDERPNEESGPDKFARELGDDWNLSDIVNAPSPHPGDDGRLWRHNRYVRSVNTLQRLPGTKWPIQYRQTWMEVHEFVVVQVRDPRNSYQVGNCKYFTFEIEMSRCADLHVPSYAFLALDPDEYHNLCTTGELLALRTQFRALDDQLAELGLAAGVRS